MFSAQIVYQVYFRFSSGERAGSWEEKMTNEAGGVATFAWLWIIWTGWMAGRYIILVDCGNVYRILHSG